MSFWSDGGTEVRASRREWRTERGASFGIERAYDVPRKVKVMLMSDMVVVYVIRSRGHGKYVLIT